jgi:hypothetical protein
MRKLAGARAHGGLFAQALIALVVALPLGYQR